MCLDGVIGHGLGCGLRFRQHVLGQRQHHRPGPPVDRRVEGAADQFGNACGVVDLRHPLRHLREGAPVVQLLKCFAFDGLTPHLADEEQQRRGILKCDVQPGGGVCGSGRTGDETNAGAATELSVSIRHHSRRALVTAHGELDFRSVVERIEHREITFPGETEGLPHTVRLQSVDEQLPAGLCLRFTHWSMSRGSRKRRRGRRQGAGARNHVQGCAAGMRAAVPSTVVRLSTRAWCAASNSVALCRTLRLSQMTSSPTPHRWR